MIYESFNRRIAATALTIGLGMGALACSNNGETTLANATEATATASTDRDTTQDTIVETTDKKTTSTTDRATTTSEATANTVALDGEMVANAPVHNDESLRDGNFKCGGEKTMTSTDSFEYKFDFFSEDDANKELGRSYMDVLVTDAKWGMGEKAFDVIKASAYVNAATEANADGKTSGNEDLDAYISRVFSHELETQKTYVNGDCRTVANTVTMPSPDVPVIRIGGEEGNAKKSTVEGVVLPADAIEAWKEAVTKDAEGNILFDIIPITIEDEDGKLVEAFLIVTAANGCDNEIRVPIVPPKTPTPETPTTTTIPKATTTTVETTTTTTPDTTTSTTIPKTTTTTIADTTSTRPEVTVPASEVIQGPGAGGEPDDDNDADNNTTIRPVPPTTPAPGTTVDAPTTTATIPATNTTNAECGEACE